MSSKEKPYILLSAQCLPRQLICTAVLQDCDNTERGWWPRPVISTTQETKTGWLHIQSQPGLPWVQGQPGLLWVQGQPGNLLRHLKLKRNERPEVRAHTASPSTGRQRQVISVKQAALENEFPACQGHKWDSYLQGQEEERKNCGLGVSFMGRALAWHVEVPGSINHNQTSL